MGLYSRIFNKEEALKLLNKIDGIFWVLEDVSKKDNELEQIEYHDMLREGIISPHSYYTAKYKYKDLIISTSTLYDSHIGRSSRCTIYAPIKEQHMKYKGREITEESQLTDEENRDWANMEFYTVDTDGYETVCEMRTQDTLGFKYEWMTFDEHRDEIERLLFPEIFEE